VQTRFAPEQLADSGVREADGILRACVHCGFCLATCPTYVLLGDELDSPRGRIYLIKDMLENDRPATARVAKHIDRCLSCLSCMTTCPSGVHYQHLVDLARVRIAITYRRPWPERLLGAFLSHTLPRPRAFRFALLAARLARPFARHLPGRLNHVASFAPETPPRASAQDRRQVFAPEGKRVMRVALLPGCVQQVLAPEINAATIRLLTRHGVEVAVAKNAGCCGALTHHMGREDEALTSARANIAAWEGLTAREGLDAIVVNASGCGTMVKDYGFLLRDDPAWAGRAARVSELARDVAEVIAKVGLDPQAPRGMVVAYHSACSLQHGQGIHDLPKALLAGAGFDAREVPEGHICCGSAGTYNLMQPDLAARLAERKAANIERLHPDAVASGNIGCIVQIARATRIPTLHTVELLDWATGGPVPPALAKSGAAAAAQG
jgi:glycolate oxidase iron-sulfur subunit